MATYHYYLRKDGKATEAAAIHLHIHLGGKRLVYPTGCKVLPKHWDPDKERVTTRVPTCAVCSANVEALAAGNTEVHRSINERLTQLQAAATHFITTFGRTHNRLPELHELREDLKRADGAPVGDTPVDLIGYFEAYNERRKGMVHRHSTRPLHSTLHGRNRKAVEYLKEFVASQNKGRIVPVHFNGLDADFISGFQAYLTRDQGACPQHRGQVHEGFP